MRVKKLESTGANFFYEHDLPAGPRTCTCVAVFEKFFQSLSREATLRPVCCLQLTVPQQHSTVHSSLAADVVGGTASSLTFSFIQGLIVVAVAVSEATGFDLCPFRRILPYTT